MTTSLTKTRIATAAVAGIALGIGAATAGGTAANAAITPIGVGLDAPGGEAPTTAFLSGSTIYYPGGETVEISKKAEVTDLAMIGENVAVLHGSDTAPRLDIFAPNGDHVAGHNLAAASIAVDETNTLLAFVSVNTGTVVLEDGGQTATELRSANADNPEVSAVEGSTAGDATVAINDGDTSYVVSAHGTVEALPHQIHDINDRGELLSTLSVDHEHQGTTSGLVSIGDVEWEQDGYLTDSFSPDDEIVLGGDSYRSGAGDTTIGLLDAETGELSGAFEAEDGLVFVDVVWEDSDHLLATVTPEGVAPDAQSVLRLNTKSGKVEPEVAVRGEDSIQIAD